MVSLTVQRGYVTFLIRRPPTLVSKANETAGERSMRTGVVVLLSMQRMLK